MRTWTLSSRLFRAWLRERSRFTSALGRCNLLTSIFSFYTCLIRIHFGSLAGFSLSRLTFHPLIESPNSLLRLPFKNRRIASLSMAAEDFKAAVSLQPSPESVALQYARQAIVNMARAMRVTPLDMVYVDVKDPVGLEKECVQGREMGFGGKWCIHPSQIEACNKVFGAEDQPKKASYADVDWN